MKRSIIITETAVKADGSPIATKKPKQERNSGGSIILQTGPSGSDDRYLNSCNDIDKQQLSYSNNSVATIIATTENPANDSLTTPSLDKPLPQNYSQDDSSRNERIISLVKRIKECGTDVQRCIRIVKEIDDEILASNIITAVCDDCYVAALQVCLNASKKIQKKKAKKIRTTTTKVIKRVKPEHLYDETKTSTAGSSNKDLTELHCSQPLVDNNNNNKLARKNEGNNNNISNSESDSEERIMIRDFVVQISKAYPTVSCYAKCISIYGLLGYYDHAMELYEHQQSQLLQRSRKQQSTKLATNDNDYNMKDVTTTSQNININDQNSSSSSSASIILLQAMLAACVPSGEWKLAWNVLSSAITKGPSNNIVTTASCNIVLNAMCTAREGIHAYELVQTMIQSQQQQQQYQGGNFRSEPTTDTNERWPPPDKSSFLYVMNALIRQQQTSTNMKQQSKSNDDTVEPFTYIDVAFDLLNPLMRQLRTSSSSDSSEIQQIIKPHLDVLINGYRQIKCSVMVDYITTSLRNHNLLIDDPNTILPTPNEIRSEYNEFGNDFIDGRDKDGGNNENRNALRQKDESTPSLFVHWDDEVAAANGNKPGRFVKHGRGRFAYWAYATYKDTATNRTLTVALQPNTDPLRNGIKILLYDTSTTSSPTNTTVADNKNNEFRVKAKFHNGKKVGYLLIRNSSINDTCTPVDPESDTNSRQRWHGTSTFLGMYLDPNYRKEKLSKVFLSLWLDLCCKSNLEPVTGIINKPLLALILHDTFRFQPIGGFDVEIIPKDKSKSLTITTSEEVLNDNDSNLNDTVNDESVIELYSPRASKTLIGGALAGSDLKRENIRLVQRNTTNNDDKVYTTNSSTNGNSSTTYKPKTNRRTFRLGCSFKLQNDDSPTTGSTCHPELDHSTGKSINITSLSLLQELVATNLKGPMGSGILQYYYDDNDNTPISDTTTPWTKIMLGK